MGFLDCASANSIWRGYDYFKEKRVLEVNQISKDMYSASVAGSDSSVYSVTFDIKHPRRSTCNCPHANGRRVICKHIVAAYFTQFPEEAKKLYEDSIKYEKEEMKRQQIIRERVVRYINSLEKSDLQRELSDLLFLDQNGNMTVLSETINWMMIYINLE